MCFRLWQLIEDVKGMLIQKVHSPFQIRFLAGTAHCHTTRRLGEALGESSESRGCHIGLAVTWKLLRSNKRAPRCYQMNTSTSPQVVVISHINQPRSSEPTLPAAWLVVVWLLICASKTKVRFRGARSPCCATGFPKINAEWASASRASPFAGGISKQTHHCCDSCGWPCPPSATSSDCS